MWTLKSAFLGSHLWIAPAGAAFTSPSAGTVSQNGAVWPDANEPNWANWALGIVETLDIDPKVGSKEIIMAPSPGAVEAVDILIPYAIPELSVTLLQTPALAPQLALNTQQLFATNTSQFTPNGGGGPGQRGIMRLQQYDQNNNLLLNVESWVFVELKSALKGAPKSMTKPEFLITLLAANNNTGSV